MAVDPSGNQRIKKKRLVVCPFHAAPLRRRCVVLMHDLNIFGKMYRYKSAVIYGLSLAALLFLLKWLELRFVVLNHAWEIYAGIIALLFTALGIWIATRLAKPRIETVVVEKHVFLEKGNGFERNEAVLKRLNLSQRELEVLELMAEGLTNQQIAARLFLSLNTVKTHSVNLYEKMDVARRTQAVAKGRALSLIP